MKILLLQLKRIGDLILTTPAIAALREKFLEASITLVVSRECEDLLDSCDAAQPNGHDNAFCRRARKV